MPSGADRVSAIRFMSSRQEHLVAASSTSAMPKVKVPCELGSAPPDVVTVSVISLPAL